MLGVILSDMDDKKPKVEELTDEEKREILEKNGAHNGIVVRIRIPKIPDDKKH